MTPDDVRSMVERGWGEAVRTCLAALEQPDTVVDADEILEHSAATADLLTIYRRRADHVEDIGLPTLGFARLSIGSQPRDTTDCDSSW